MRDGGILPYPDPGHPPRPGRTPSTVPVGMGAGRSWPPSPSGSGRSVSPSPPGPWAGSAWCP